MKLENSKILITGGAGFIGSNLCEKLLKNNNHVICLDNFLTGSRKNIEKFLSNGKFSLIEGNICNIKDCNKAVKGVDYVLHQAALGSVPRSIIDPILTTDINISGFVNILSASIGANVKRFVYAASSSTYGDHVGLPKVEEKIGNPLSPYAITKYVNEMFAQNFSKIYDIEIIGLRYFNVFGKNQSPDGAYAAVIPKFMIQLMNHKSPIINGDGNYSRDFTYIENVVQANILAMTTDSSKLYSSCKVNHQVFNVAYGQRTTLNELFYMLRKSLSKFDSKILNINPIYGDNREGDIPHSLASIEKAKKFLKYAPLFNVKSGIEMACEWYWKNLK